MSQPKWKCVANLGDVNPIDHGACLVFIDETGVYPPEMELIEPPYDDSDGEKTWRVYRVVCEPCAYVDGILSDNPYHPDEPAWFAGTPAMREKRPQDTCWLSDLCDEMEDFIAMITSDDPIMRAHAWKAVFDRHGWENGDSPVLLNRSEIGSRLRRKNVATVLGN